MENHVFVLIVNLCCPHGKTDGFIVGNWLIGLCLDWVEPARLEEKDVHQGTSWKRLPPLPRLL